MFDQVTILFVNTVNFGQIINNTEPAQIIKFINSTITVYDKIVATFDHVNKVICINFFPNQNRPKTKLFIKDRN